LEIGGGDPEVVDEHGPFEVRWIRLQINHLYVEQGLKQILCVGRKAIDIGAQ